MREVAWEKVVGSGLVGSWRGCTLFVLFGALACLPERDFAKLPDTCVSEEDAIQMTKEVLWKRAWKVAVAPDAAADDGTPTVHGHRRAGLRDARAPDRQPACGAAGDLPVGPARGARVDETQLRLRGDG